jgi:hypothetical protein
MDPQKPSPPHCGDPWLMRVTATALAAWSATSWAPCMGPSPSPRGGSKTSNCVASSTRSRETCMRPSTGTSMSGCIPPLGAKRGAPSDKSGAGVRVARVTVDRETVQRDSVVARDAVADAAKDCTWRAVLALLEEHPPAARRHRPSARPRRLRICVRRSRQGGLPRRAFRSVDVQSRGQRPLPPRQSMPRRQCGEPIAQFPRLECEPQLGMRRLCIRRSQRHPRRALKE